MKNRCIGIIHAVVSLAMLIVLITQIADKTLFKGIHALLILPFAANLLISSRLNFPRLHTRRMIPLGFALKAVQAVCFSILFFDTMSTASLAVSVLCLCAAIFEGKLSFDYSKNEHIGAASRCILGGFGVLHLVVCTIFLLSADITFGYEFLLLAAGSAVCYACLLISSFEVKTAKETTA